MKDKQTIIGVRLFGGEVANGIKYPGVLVFYSKDGGSHNFFDGETFREGLEDLKARGFDVSIFD